MRDVHVSIVMKITDEPPINGVNDEGLNGFDLKHCLRTGGVWHFPCIAKQQGKKAYDMMTSTGLIAREIDGKVYQKPS